MAKDFLLGTRLATRQLFLANLFTSAKVFHGPSLHFKLHIIVEISRHRGQECQVFYLVLEVLCVLLPLDYLHSHR